MTSEFIAYSLWARYELFRFPDLGIEHYNWLHLLNPEQHQPPKRGQLAMRELR